MEPSEPQPARRPPWLARVRVAAPAVFLGYGVYRVSGSIVLAIVVAIVVAVLGRVLLRYASP